MSATVPDPQMLSFPEWGKAVCLVFPEAELPDPTAYDWREWAIVLMNKGTFSSVLVPDPLHYSHWQQWAFDLRGAADGLEP